MSEKEAYIYNENIEEYGYYHFDDFDTYEFPEEIMPPFMADELGFPASSC